MSVACSRKSDGGSVAESFADLLNDIHIGGNGSPSSLKSQPAFARSCVDLSQGDRRHSTARFRRRKEAFSNAASTSPGGSASLRRTTSTGATNLSAGPTQKGTWASLAKGTVEYAVTTKDYDGCQTSDGGQDRGDQMQKVTAIVDKALQLRFEAEAYVEVSDLPFWDGYYTGIIDHKARPHGKGTLVTRKEELNGWWYKGSFVPNEYIARTVSRLVDSTKDEIKPDEGLKIKKCEKKTKVRPQELDCDAVDHRSEYNGFRKDYRLGEVVRSPSHMIVEPTLGLAARSAGSLRKHDFAFVKRSDGSFSYALLVDRYFEGRGSYRGDEEEVLMFAVDSSLATKSFPERMWSSFVRCVAIDPNYRDAFGPSPSDQCGKSPTGVREMVRPGFLAGADTAVHFAQ